MNKTTARFVGVGAVLLLSVLALALAQHDARQSSEELVLAKSTPEQPQLIPVDESPLWGQSFATTKTIVRANDDSAPRPPSLSYADSQETAPPSPLPLANVSDNPLRGSIPSENDAAVPSLDQFSESSSVQLVSGEGPPKSGAPELPSTMPALQAPPIPALAPPDALNANTSRQRCSHPCSQTRLGNSSGHYGPERPDCSHQPFRVRAHLSLNRYPTRSRRLCLRQTSQLRHRQLYNHRQRLLLACPTSLPPCR